MPFMNNNDMEYPEDPQLSIAAALHLLSSSSVHGVSVARCEALLRHLERLSVDSGLAEPLRRTCFCLYCIWSETMQSMRGDVAVTPPVLPVSSPEGRRLH
jgi:hypothetical protein